MKRPDVSIVLPTYNDHAALAHNLPHLCEHMTRLGAAFEVLIVDDGSPSSESARSIAKDLDCRFLQNPCNLGKGAAVRRGMLAAQGRLRLFTDADVPYELSAVETALWLLDTRRFHMVAGDRTLQGSRYFADIPWARRLGSTACSFIVGRFLTGGWFDTQCGFKAFRAEVADDLFSVARIDGFAFDIELIYVALHRGYDIKRIPVRLRSQDGSSVRVLYHGAQMSRDVARIRVNFARGRYASTVPISLAQDLMGAKWPI